jgi:HEPN domain-containing protein
VRSLVPAINRSVNDLLADVFAAKHANAAVKHFQDAAQDLSLNKWDNASAKGGKFIEAALKALWVFVGETVPSGRNFSAGRIITDLERKTAFPDTVRLTMPRACRFAYEIASNRGARHDADEIDANEMDARAVISVCSWVLSEMVRLSQKGHDLTVPRMIVDGLMKRRFPFAESIDGRIYADIGSSAKEVALVILYHIYPKRISRENLVACLRRHPFKKNNAEVAVHRLTGFIDDDGAGSIQLRNTGLRKVEELFSAAKTLR